MRVEPRTVYVDATRPDHVDGFIRRTFTAMIAGVREPFCYTFFRAVAAS